ncbi:MAG: PLP-dependent aminotransferase family protein [Oscillospiraceae bacterium]|nr:PLP-dependent aminotransferase family protein [Oscillospiraceae bacterium]
MTFAVNKAGSTPAYLQLYQQCVQSIIQGLYPYGSKLPSKRTLAADSGVSVITVEHALALLCEEGYVESRERSGCFVIYRSSDFQGLPGLGAGNLPARSLSPHTAGDFPFSVLARTMRRVLADYGEQLLVKPPNSGCPELQQELCAYLARSRGLLIQPDQIIIGAGAEYLYGLVAQLIGRDGLIALEHPGYEKIHLVYEAMGIRCDYLKLHKGGIATEALERTSARILHVTPFNSYPSGISADASKKREYIRWAREREGYLIEDNYESELTVSQKQEDSLFALAGGERVIYLNSFSKTIAPSIRVGYMVLPRELAELYCQRLGFYSCTVPAFEQYLLASLLRNGDYERHINRVRRQRRKNRKIIPARDNNR